MRVFSERRYGRFRITSRLMYGAPEMVHALLSQVIVLRCELRIAEARFVYDAWSEEFPVLPDGCMPTELSIVVDHARKYLRFANTTKGQIVSLEPWEEIVT